MKNITVIIMIALAFTSCEKTVTLPYKSNQSRIVIEGNITNEKGPYFVKITTSARLQETGNYTTIDNAIVTISDDAGNSEVLTSTGQGIYATSALEGIEGRTYTLTVKVDNQTYTAQSTMPQSVALDSIKTEEVMMGGEIEWNLIPVYTDPSAEGNNYRFVLKVNDTLVNQYLVQNDIVRNGMTNTVRLEIDDNDRKLKKGDRLSLNMQCIDANVALFYTTLALMTDSGPGGGTTPNNPPNNISNGALGLFSAHTMQHADKVIP